jgi:hypothetical protein
MHRLAKPGARQRAAGDEQQRDQAGASRSARSSQTSSRAVISCRRGRGVGCRAVGISGANRAPTPRPLLPGGIQIGRELDQSCAAELNQLGVKPIQQVEGRYQLGHDTQLGRERPRLGHRSLHRSTGPIKQIESRSSLLSESAPAPRSIWQGKALF